MKDLLVCLGMARTPRGYKVFMTHNPRVDAAWLLRDNPGAGLDLLTPFLPVGVADFILKQVSAAEAREGTGSTAPAGFFQRLLGSVAGIGRAGSTVSEGMGDKGYDHLVRSKSSKAARLLARVAGVLGPSRLPGGSKQLPGTNWNYPVRIRAKELVLECHQLRGVEQSRGWEDWLEQDGQVVKDALRGRILFLEELEQCLAQEGVSVKSDLQDVLQSLYCRGEVEVLPSLGLTPHGEFVCTRCGSRVRPGGAFGLSSVADRFYLAPCPLCRFPSVYCEECNNLGEARLCRALYAVGGNIRPRSAGRTITLQGLPPLTVAQQRAAQELAAFVRDSSGMSEALVWAVCGAGKTEVVMEAIAECLRAGGQVLYAIPRRDVVRELTPRLQAAFRGIEIAALYGGSPEKYRQVPVVVATTHQVMRFYDRFDLVVLDEVDAYPYAGSRMLHMAVKRAAKAGGRTVYLTATPDDGMLKLAERGRIKQITIPARYHGRPVPEPRLLSMSTFSRQKNGTYTVNQFVMELLARWVVAQQRQVFVFLPTVSMVDTYGPVLEKAFNQAMVSYQASDGQLVRCREPGLLTNLKYCHSKDPDRDRKRDEFKAGVFSVFLTTTIMERGITVKRANVLVLEADFARIFDEGTLIQMAGRAGRSIECPDGEVVFVGSRISQAMKNAQKKIAYLNGVARKNGYLK